MHLLGFTLQTSEAEAYTNLLNLKDRLVTVKQNGCLAMGLPNKMAA